MTGFEKTIYSLCKKIPPGKVSTYKFLAQAAGKPRAYRAAANALAKNKKLFEIPCHRVVRSNGLSGGYAGGSRNKTMLLKQEGVKFKGNKILKNLIVKING
ncbi:MGMT family protein [Candidatus Parcubacteria bacterium]|nr:MAG: MGMT family protein [Candidatus Parcubacteria bacterium]